MVLVRPRSCRKRLEKSRPMLSICGFRESGVETDGKMYVVGPGLTLDGFEVHLANRAHLENVKEKRTGRG